MSYADEDEPVPPTVVERALAVVDRERGFIADLLLLVTVAVALSTSPSAWAWIGFGALLIHTILLYRGK